jgi:hypothetical protein
MAKEVVIEHAWEVQGLQDGLAPIGRAMLASPHGLHGGGDGGQMELTGGSQAELRTLGAWFVNRTQLPKRVRATYDGTTLHARFESTMGFGLMDPMTRRKYRTTLELIAADFEAATRASAQQVSARR